MVAPANAAASTAGDWAAVPGAASLVDLGDDDQLPELFDKAAQLVAGVLVLVSAPNLCVHAPSGWLDRPGVRSGSRGNWTGNLGSAAPFLVGSGLLAGLALFVGSLPIGWVARQVWFVLQGARGAPLDGALVPDVSILGPERLISLPRVEGELPDLLSLGLVPGVGHGILGPEPDAVPFDPPPHTNEDGDCGEGCDEENRQVHFLSHP